MPSRIEHRLARQKAIVRASTTIVVIFLILAITVYSSHYFSSFPISEFVAVNPDGVPSKGLELILVVEDEAPTASLFLNRIELDSRDSSGCAAAMFLTVITNRSIHSRPSSEHIIRTEASSSTKPYPYQVLRQAPISQTTSRTNGSSLTESETSFFEFPTPICLDSSSTTQDGSIAYSEFSFGSPELVATDIPLTTRSGIEFFPYDQYVLSFAVGLLSDVTDLPPSDIGPGNVPLPATEYNFALPLEIQIQAPAWHTSTSVNRGEGRKGYITEIKLTRSPILTTLTAILGITALALIVSLLLIRELSSALEVGVGLFFGLWAVRSFIVPSYITRTTVVDYVALVMYMVLSILMLSLLIQEVLNKRVESVLSSGNKLTQEESADEIDSNAIDADSQQEPTRTKNLDGSATTLTDKEVDGKRFYNDTIDYQI